MRNAHVAYRAAGAGGVQIKRKEHAGGTPVPHRGRRHRRAGLTLIELIVVITILGVLAALIVSGSVWRIGEAKQKVATTNLKVIEGKLQEFYADCGRLPSSQEGLQALLRAPADVASKWKGPYVKEKEILDPWGNTFVFRSPGVHNTDFDVMSLGADRQEGGEGENADVGNW